MSDDGWTRLNAVSGCCHTLGLVIITLLHCYYILSNLFLEFRVGMMILLSLEPLIRVGDVGITSVRYYQIKVNAV